MHPVQENFLDISTIYHVGNETTSAARKNDQTELSQEKIDKVTRLQAYIRGWKARNEVFLPQQILPLVKQHFVEYGRDFYDILLPPESWNLGWRESSRH